MAARDPASLVTDVLNTLRCILTAVSLVTVVFTRRIPRSVFDAIAMTYRYLPPRGLNRRRRGTVQGALTAGDASPNDGAADGPTIWPAASLGLMARRSQWNR